MNYRSVMVLGTAVRVVGADEDRALRIISEHLLPGRWAQVRHPDPKERAATMVLAMPLDECSVKVRTGPPEDTVQDLDDPHLSGVWAGVVGIEQRLVAPEDAPDYVRAWSDMPLRRSPALNYSDEP